MAIASPRFRYLLAVAAAGGAVLVAPALHVLPQHARLLVPLAATASCALALGLGPALLCLAAVGLAAPYFLLGVTSFAALGADDALALSAMAASALPPLWVAGRTRGALYRALQEERAARRAAEEQNRAKDEFLATLSHELRGPVGAILGWVDLLRGGLEERDAQRAIESIARNAQTQARLVAEVLDVSRIVSGRMRLAMDDVDLRPLLADALDTARPKAVANGVTLEALALDGGVVVRGDPSRLMQVIANLLDNAVKFTPRNGRVSVALRRNGSVARLEVTDTGEGIPAELIPLLFERYRQVHPDSERAHDGLGLGLSIVRHLVECHGGTVRASSAGVGKGTSFAVELPLAGAARKDQAPAASAAARAVPSSAPPALEKGIDR